MIWYFGTGLIFAILALILGHDEDQDEPAWYILPQMFVITIGWPICLAYVMYYSIRTISKERKK